MPPDTEALWREAAPFVQRAGGVLAVDDTTLDKPYARRMDLATRHGSGKHGRGVQGINGISLLWPRGRERLPWDVRIDHIARAIRAFLRLEVARWQHDITWLEAKHAMIRETICHDLAHPTFILQSIA